MSETENINVNIKKEEPAQNNTRDKLLRLAILLAVFFVVASSVFQDGGISAEYIDTGVILRGGGSRTEILFEQIEAVEELQAPFQMGEPVDAKEKESYFAGIYSGGDLDGEYTLYLDKLYEGEILLLRCADQTVVIGCATVDMPFLKDYLRSGAGLD